MQAGLRAQKLAGEKIALVSEKAGVCTCGCWRETEEALGGAGQALTVESPGKPPEGKQTCST